MNLRHDSMHIQEPNIGTSVLGSIVECCACEWLECASPARLVALFSQFLAWPGRDLAKLPYFWMYSQLHSSILQSCPAATACSRCWPCWDPCFGHSKNQTWRVLSPSCFCQGNANEDNTFPMLVRREWHRYSLVTKAAAICLAKLKTKLSDPGQNLLLIVVVWYTRGKKLNRSEAQDRTAARLHPRNNSNAKKSGICNSSQ